MCVENFERMLPAQEMSFSQIERHGRQMQMEPDHLDQDLPPKKDEPDGLDTRPSETRVFQTEQVQEPQVQIEIYDTKPDNGACPRYRRLRHRYETLP
jgi:hypothetical protein